MATTISRPTLTDDSGTPASPVGDGDLVDAAFFTDLYDRIDAMWSGGTQNFGGLLDVDGLGTHVMTAAGVGGNILRIENSQGGSGNFAQVQLGTDAQNATGALSALSSTWSTSGVNHADGVALSGNEAGGLSLAATHASGDLRLYAGGTTQIATFDGDTITLSGGTPGTHALSGRLNSDTSQVGTDADLNTKVLHTYTLPAGTLASNGQAIRVSATLTTSNNGNTKTIDMRFGTTVVVTETFVANAHTVHLEAIVIRTGAATQKGSGWILSEGASGGTQEHDSNFSMTETLSNALAVEIRGTNGTAAANEIVCEMSVVEFLP